MYMNMPTQPRLKSPSFGLINKLIINEPREKLYQLLNYTDIFCYAVSLYGVFIRVRGKSFVRGLI